MYKRSLHPHEGGWLQDITLHETNDRQISQNIGEIHSKSLDLLAKFIQNLFHQLLLLSYSFFTKSNSTDGSRAKIFREINEKNWMKKIKNIFSFHFYQSSWNQKVDKYQELFLYIHRTQNWQTHCYLMKDRICWKVGSSHHAS